MRRALARSGGRTRNRDVWGGGGARGGCACGGDILRDLDVNQLGSGCDAIDGLGV